MNARKRPIIARNSDTRMGYVYVKEGFGGYSTVTSETGSHYMIRTSSIEWPARGHEMTDPEPNREPKMDSSAPQRDAGGFRAWDEGTPAGESGPCPSRTDVDPGAGRALNRLTDGDRRMIVQALRFEADCYLGNVYPIPAAGQWQFDAAKQRTDLADRIERGLP